MESPNIEVGVDWKKDVCRKLGLTLDFSYFLTGGVQDFDAEAVGGLIFTRVPP